MRTLLIAILLVLPGCTLDPCMPCVHREVLAFSEPWCAPCRANRPAIEALERRGVSVSHFGLCSDAARQFQISVVPTYIVLENHVEIERTHDVHVVQEMFARF